MARIKYSKVKGVDQVMRNLNKEIEQMKKRSMRGMIEASIIVRRDAEPMTPVDWGNLVNSWFVVTAKSIEKGEATNFRGPNAGEIAANHSQTLSRERFDAAKVSNKLLLIMGYSANYAAPVHEMVGANFKKPGAMAKFFEKALKDNYNGILNVIAKHARIKK